MHITFKTNARRLPVLAFALLCVAFGAQAQSRDARIVTARAGGVNYISGSVSVKLEGQTEWAALTTEQNLDSGDAVKTGANGRVEVLLNPGSYLRVGENSEFELADASLDDLRIKLLKGSAVVEATGYGDVELLIAVETPHTKVSIIRSGIYRLNVLPSGITEVAVFKGRALVGPDQATLVKGGQTARVVGGSNIEVAKLDKKNKDALDVWSKERAGELASANRKLQARLLRPALARMSLDDFWMHGSSRFGPSGLWAFNARVGCYTFLPLYGNWSSPYGGYYDRRIYGGDTWCRGCQHNPSGQSPTFAPGGGTATSYPTPGGGTASSPSPAPAPLPREMPSPSSDIVRPHVEAPSSRSVSGPVADRPPER